MGPAKPTYPISASTGLGPNAADSWFSISARSLDYPPHEDAGSLFLIP